MEPSKSQSTSNWKYHMTLAIYARVEASVFALGDVPHADRGE